MDLSSPYKAVVPTVEGAVLTVLAATTRPLTGREAARLTERSEAGARRALRRLVEHGIVLADEAGKATLHRLNRDHLAAPAVETLAGMRTELVRRLRSAIEGWVIKPVYASLFGSAARGDGDTDSDIDVLVVRPAEIPDSDDLWNNQVAELGVLVLRWTGNHAAIAVLPLADAERLETERPPIAEALSSEAVPIWGDTP
jgi:Nucleotidyltransferase domain/IclR helix-turn-helix domain